LVGVTIIGTVLNFMFFTGGRVFQPAIELRLREFVFKTECNGGQESPPSVFNAKGGWSAVAGIVLRILIL
jgi:hypothetical protein